MTQPASPPPLDAAGQARLRTLSEELRCLVCQNQTLADSHADLAVDLRKDGRGHKALHQGEKQEGSEGHARVEARLPPPLCLRSSSSCNRLRLHMRHRPDWSDAPEPVYRPVPG